MGRALGALPVFGMMVILLGGCASFTPDRYDPTAGVWIRGDGTTYEAPAPIQVLDASIKSARMRERVRTEETKSTNDKGETVIRQKDVVELTVDVDVEVVLMNNEKYNLFFSGMGREGSSGYVGSAFTASNGYVYRAAGSLQFTRDRSRLQLSIESKGPVLWQNTLAFDYR